MTRKDFELIAETIAALNLKPKDRIHVAASFARALTCSNPRFDVSRFLDACAPSDAVTEGGQS